MTTQTDRMIERFAEAGFLRIPEAVHLDLVARLNRAIDSDLADHDDWSTRGNGHRQHANLLPRTDAFDPALTLPAIVPILRGIMGEKVCVEELSAMLRDPTTEQSKSEGWHRDFGRADDRPHGIHALSLVIYLTEVGPNDHCFAIVPGTHLNDRDPNDAAADAQEIHGAPGTALLFHTSCVHAARLKPESRQRRTLHIYYGYSDSPPVSAFTEIPQRLTRQRDPELPATFFINKRGT